MSEPVVEFQRVSKTFLLRRNPVDSLKVRMVGLFNPRQREQRETFWALREVDLTVRRGEFLGVIGPNGSGKSTLLRMIADIYPPTHGRVSVQGRVVPMIELGVGFHPDLNGRENVYLNTSLYGLSTRQTDAIFGAIVEFSEIREFLELPAKSYSLGMYMRLAFSTAVHLDPDILLIDEVLAVGDAHFQRKCLTRMEQIHAGGKTIILVSHDLESIERLCTRVCLLRRGRIEAEGAARDITRHYRGLMNQERRDG